MRSQKAAIEQEKQETQQRMASLQQEIQSLRALHQQIEQLLEDKTKEAAEREICLENRLSNLQQELVQKDKFFADEVEVCKGEIAQDLLVGFKVAVEQASSLHPSLDFSQLGPNKRVVNRQLAEE